MKQKTRFKFNFSHFITCIFSIKFTIAPLTQKQYENHLISRKNDMTVVENVKKCYNKSLNVYKPDKYN